MYNVYYKSQRVGTVVIPCKSESQGKRIADNLFKQGKHGVKLSKVEETVLYIPTVDQ